MKPPRFFTSVCHNQQGSPLGSFVVLSAEDSHHVKSVLRLKVGDPIEVSDPSSGGVYLARIVELSGEVRATIENELRAMAKDASADAPAMILLCALCKGEKNDLITDWATELGCSSILFWPSEHSVMKLRSAEERLKKQDRYRKIGLAAAKQSRQVKPPSVLIAESLNTAIAIAQEMTPTTPGEIGHNARWYCSLSPGAPRVTSTQGKLNSVQVVIGPEGDFSRNEEVLLCDSGYSPITLGERVLRSELAVVSALVSLQQLFRV